MNTFFKNKLDLLFISLIVWGLLKLFALPEIERYSTEIIGISKNVVENEVYYNDLNNDDDPERITFSTSYNFPTISIESNTISEHLNLTRSFVSLVPVFGDINSDGYTEIAFLSKQNDSVFVNILQVNNGLSYLIEERFVSTISQNHTGGYDVSNKNFNFFYDTNHDGHKELIFNLLAEYSFQPRGLFAFDIKNDTLIRSPKSGMYFSGIDTMDVNRNGELEFYFTSHATSNGPNGWEQYPDTAAWLMILRKDFEFLFPPIPFYGAGSALKTQLVQNSDSNYLAVFHTNKHLKRNAVLALYTEQGKFIRSKTFDRNKYQNIRAFGNTAPDTEFIYLYDSDGYVYMLDQMLEISSRKRLINPKLSKQILYANYDVTGDKKKELIYIYPKGVTVLGKGLSKLFSIKIRFPDFSRPSLYQKNGKTILHFRAKQGIWYTIEISENRWFRLRYLMLIGLYISIYIVLFVLKTAWLRKLKLDNIKLNQIVNERTSEIENQRLLLELQNHELKENEEFKQVLASMLVHDLKKPLQAIIAYTEQRLGKYSSQLEAYSSQMLNLVMNILDVQKYETNKIELNIQQHQLQKCAAMAIVKLEVLANEKELLLDSNMSVEHLLEFDFEIIERVFINIISNAIKYSKPGGSVLISQQFMQTEGQPFSKISITDYGTGIPKALHNTIFEKYTADTNAAYSYATGLGLYYCRIMIEAHGGRIWLESEMQKGTSVWFTLPAKEIPKTQARVILPTTKKLQVVTFNFTESEKVQIQRFSLALRAVDFFEITELYRILDTATERSAELANWIQAVRQSIDSFNQKKFDRLTTVVKLIK